MRSINNDQNIERLCPKMSEGFHDENNENLSKIFDDINSIEENLSDEEINVIDHMYTSNANNEEQDDSTPSLNCQTAESEVRLIKDWLILHTDLIQQQNDDIIERDREIYILRKENEMLKKQIYCLENGIPYQLYKVCSPKLTEESQEAISEDMTQGPSEEDSKDNIEYIEQSICEGEDISVEVTNYSESNLNVSDNESQLESEIIESDNTYPIENHNSELEFKTEELVLNELSDTFVSDSDLLNCNSFSDYNFTIENIVSEIDPMKNLRMSIRRKRVCSGSSALSSNELGAVENKKPFGDMKKKKRLTKDSQILTSSEPYITQAHDVSLGIIYTDPDLPDSSLTTLEVPRWRHKVYPSCYTLEGTENLDDEVYNKRHMRLEIDERRRKRWDVQRIREQRVIEKLKLRHEKAANSGPSKGEERHRLPSLWPKLEDIKFLEINDELPVSAFGSPIPKISSSEFNLPWLMNPTLLTPKKTHIRRSTVRKKSKR